MWVHGILILRYNNIIREINITTCISSYFCSILVDFISIGTYLRLYLRQSKSDNLSIINFECRRTRMKPNSLRYNVKVREVECL